MWATGAYGYLLDYLLWFGLFVSLLVQTACLLFLPVLSNRPRCRLVLGNALLSLCALSALAFGAESYLRFLSTTTDVFGATLTCKRWFRAYPKLNSLLFRDLEWTPKKPEGVRRIAFVGDSYTYGWGIDDVVDRFTERLRREFDERSPRQVEVMNVAWVGWESTEQLRAIQRLQPYFEIDEIVLCYLPNDIESVLQPRTQLNPARPPPCRWFNTRTSFLADYIYYRLVAPRRYGGALYWDWLADGFNDPTTWKRHADILKATHEFCRERGVTFRVVLLPFLVRTGERYDEVAVHTKLAGLFKEWGVPTLDMLPVVRTHPVADLVVNRHDPHPNELAHRLFANAIRNAFYAEQPR